MTTFTIDNETNHITADPATQEADSAAGTEHFDTADTFAELAAHWPPARLIEIWNNLPGVTPVKRFKDRATAVSRIWKAIQSPGASAPAMASDSAPVPAEGAPAAPVAPQTPDVGSEQPPAKTKASRAPRAPVAATKKGVRESTKTATVLALIKRSGGASLKEIIEATGWQAHSVRGFISGTLRKRMSIPVVSTATGDGGPSYSIEV